MPPPSPRYARRASCKIAFILNQICSEFRKRNNPVGRIPFSPNIYWPLISGRVRKSEPVCSDKSSLRLHSSSSRPLLPKRVHLASLVKRQAAMSQCRATFPIRKHLALPSTLTQDYGETHGMERRAQRDLIYSREMAETSGQAVGGRPAGCPHSFCGCGASIRVFGQIVPELNLAANWLRFPRASPAPGMVAARHGHVFVLEQHVEGDTWMAYDANSGGHATRVHARSLRGYTVVNPHA